MFLRHITESQNNVGTWAPGHGFYLLRRSLTHYASRITHYAFSEEAQQCSGDTCQAE